MTRHQGTHRPIVFRALTDDFDHGIDDRRGMIFIGAEHAQMFLCGLDGHFGFLSDEKPHAGCTDAAGATGDEDALSRKSGLHEHPTLAR